MNSRVVAILLFVTSTLLAYEYPDQAVSSFMNSCTNGSSRKVCRCMIKYLQENYSYSKFEAMSNRATTGALTGKDIDALQSASDECGGNFSASRIQQQSPSSGSTPEFQMRKARICETMEKNAKECWARAERLPDNSYKITQQGICGQMDMQYTINCSH